MATYATENIRTVALVGQGASGKTTLAEALLLKSGAIKEAGTVERGSTVADFDALEKSWQHSLRASILHLDTQDTRVHLMQTPPMHSAKKLNGKPLYELARSGIEVDRQAKLCHLYDLSFSSYVPPFAEFQVTCSSGTYIRTLSQDFARKLGSVGMLTRLHRTGSGSFDLSQAMDTNEISDEIERGTNWQDVRSLFPLIGFFKDTRAQKPLLRTCRR